MHVIAKTFPELIQSLRHAGFLLPVFRRSPVRIAGMWRCEISDGR